VTKLQLIIPNGKILKATKKTCLIACFHRNKEIYKNKPNFKLIWSIGKIKWMKKRILNFKK